MTGEERRQALLTVFEQLDARRQDMLMEFAATLAAHDDASVPATKRPEPRPEQESVVAAIKRLTRVYPGAERRRLMGPVSMLMAQHALQGGAAAQVIDELEALFERHYLDAVNAEK